MKHCNGCKTTKTPEEFGWRNKAKGYRNSRCIDCGCIARAAYYTNNKDREITNNKQYVLNNKATLLPKRKIISKRWDEQNPEKRKETAKRYKSKNIDLTNSLTAKRRASKLNATPKWLSTEHFTEIKSFYKKAKELEIEDGVKRHVDHVIPLQGKDVCGLHVPWNLQILTAVENVRKFNRVISDV